jgi:hypothetical protein
MNMKHTYSERGASAALVAISMIFLLGAAALAVDTAGFYVDARADQTTADLACLSGAAELPDTAAAIAAAAEVTTLNWPEKTLSAPTIVGNVGTMTDGAGNTVTIDAQYNGNTDQMSVVVSEQSATDFGAVIGVGAVTVVQEAVCEGTPGSSGAGTLPMALIPGPFNGGLFGPNPCGSNSGNCGGLDVGNGASSFEDNIANGVDRVFQKHHGNDTGIDIGTPPWYPSSGNTAVSCDSVASGEACSIAKTKTGQMAGPLGSGFVDRLSNDPGATCTFTYSGNTLNCDTPTQILGATPQTLFAAFAGVAPGWWEPSIYGPFTAAATANHYYWNSTVAKCESPRRSKVPIVDNDVDWEIGDPPSGWPNGSKPMKFIALVDIIVKDPNDPGDFQGSSSAKRVSADVIWYGPSAVCTDGSPAGVLNGETGSDTEVKLIAG